MATRKWKQPFHQARRFLAKYWLKLHPQVTVIGITGSYGKTNTTRAIAQVLSEKFKVLQTDLNLDTNYNLPITLLKLRNHQKLVLEYGVDHKGEMDAHLKLARPSIAVVTGINPTHSEPELLGSLEGVIKEKSKILAKSKLAILNKDDQYVRQMKPRISVLWCSSVSKADFWADEIKVDFKGTTFALYHGDKKVQIKTGLVGRHFVQTCLAAAAVGVTEGLSWEQIQAGLAKLEPLKGRLNIEKGPKGSILINDALRANPASTLAGLQVLNDLPRQPAGRRIAVLGEMGELGQLAKKEHQRVGQELAKLKMDFLISVGPLQKFTAQAAIKEGMKKNQVFWVKDVAEAAEILQKILKKGDLFYLKGSLLRHMERILLILRGGKVNCFVSNCHHYQPCTDCPNLQKSF